MWIGVNIHETQMPSDLNSRPIDFQRFDYFEMCVHVTFAGSPAKLTLYRGTFHRSIVDSNDISTIFHTRLFFFNKFQSLSLVR